MANISPAGAAAIREHVTDWSLDDAMIAAALNAPAIANPDPQPTVAKPFITLQLMGLLDGPALDKLQDRPWLGSLRADIKVGEIEPLDNWIAILRAGDTVTIDQATALHDMIHATELDPAWPAQISWAQANLGRPVDFQDVATARDGVTL